MREHMPGRQEWIVQSRKWRAVLRVGNGKFAAHGERGDERQNKKHERENEGALATVFRAKGRLEENRVAPLEQFRRRLCGRTAICISILHDYRLHEGRRSAKFASRGTFRAARCPNEQAQVLARGGSWK